jgi:hypothetical protein
MTITNRPTEPINRIHLFHEEVVPRLENAANIIWDLAYRATDADEKTRLFNKTHALKEIIRQNEHRLTHPQTDVDETIRLIAFVKETARMDRLDEAGINLAVDYMMEMV